MPRRSARGLRLVAERELTQGERDALFADSVPAWARLLKLTREAPEESDEESEPKEAA